MDLSFNINTTTTRLVYQKKSLKMAWKLAVKYSYRDQMDVLIMLKLNCMKLTFYQSSYYPISTGHEGDFSWLVSSDCPSNQSPDNRCVDFFFFFTLLPWPYFTSQSKEPLYSSCPSLIRNITDTIALIYFYFITSILAECLCVCVNLCKTQLRWKEYLKKKNSQGKNPEPNTMFK